MITRACRWAKLEFGLGDIKKKELVTLRNSSDPSKGMPEKDFISAIIAIKENNTAGYYRNLEYRLGQTIKKEKNKTEKENLKVIYRQLIKYNWSRDPSNLRCEGSQNVLSPSDAPPGTPGPPGPADSSELPGFSGSPEPSTSNADEQRADKRKVKKESIRTLTKAEREKFDACIQREDLKFNELNIVEVNINNTLPRYYMKSDDGIVRHVGRDPVIFSEAQGAEGPKDIKGCDKLLTSRDNQYVKLETKSKSKSQVLKFEDRMEFNKLAIERLRKYPSLCSSFFVSDTEMISVNGGENLQFVRKNGHRLNLNQFSQLMKDLYEMQKEALFMTDLKLANLVCFSPNEMVKLIDLDSIDDGEGDDVFVVTKDYITRDLEEYYHEVRGEYLINIRSESDKIKLHQSISNIVSYSLFKCLIEATQGRDITPKDEYRFSSIGREAEIFLNSHNPESYLQQKEINDITKQWIRDNVKKEHQDIINQWSINPHLFDGIIDFSEVLEFKQSALRFSLSQREFEI